MATVAGERLFGKAIKRREDPRFITGRGQYVDDVKLPGMTYAAFVRSQHAHAKIRRIDASAALKHPGVVAVFTGKDMTGVNSLPCGWDLRKEKNIPGVVQDLAMVPHMPLMSDAARHVGDPVAVVIADSQAAAVDAADKVKVDWEPLPSVTATDKAARAGAPQIHTSAPGNVAFKWALGDAAATDTAFKGAAVTVKKRILNQRLVANAMEPRACIARFDTATGELTLWVTSQNPHVHRLLMCAFVLGIPEHKVRVIAPDVGGGFGSKIFLYNEEVVCSWASRRLKRPVRWTASRREAYLTDAHGRDHVTDAEIALARDGKILGLRVKTTANLGAYLSTFAPAVPTFLYGTLLNGVYTIGAIHCEVTGVFSNTTAVDAYRGAGRPEACYAIERIVEAGARGLGMDVAELRKKNFIPKFSARIRRTSPSAMTAVTTARRSTASSRCSTTGSSGPTRRPRASRGDCSASASRPTSRPAQSRRRSSSARSGPAPASTSPGKSACTPPAWSPCSPARTRTGRATRRRSRRSWPTSSAFRSSRSTSCTATPGQWRSAWAPTAAAP